MMRAKMVVQSVSPYGEGYNKGEVLAMTPVCGMKPFGTNGESEDNTFARWTPSGAMTLCITNPDLLGKFKVGDKFYLDFTPAPADS